MTPKRRAFETPFGVAAVGDGPDPFATTVATIVREAITAAGGETVRVTNAPRGRVRILTLRVGARELATAEFDAVLHSIATPASMTFQAQAVARTMLSRALVAALSGKQRAANPSPAPAGEEALGGGSRKAAAKPPKPEPHRWSLRRRSDVFPERFNALPPPLDLSLRSREIMPGRKPSPFRLGLLAMKLGEDRTLPTGVIASSQECVDAHLSNLKAAGHGEWRKAILHDGTTIFRRVA